MPIQNRNGALFLATGIDNSGLYSGLRQAENQIGSFENFVTQSGQRIGTALGIGFGVVGLKSFASEIINVRGEMQMLSTSFEALLGNKASADAMIGGIKDYVLNSPYSITGLSKASQLLLAFGVDSEKIMPTLKQIGDISMGSSERMQSLSLAFAQMSAAGKLMGQDLLQMINAGFSPLQEMSKTTGKTINELRKDMENGAISSEMVAQAFASATSEGSRFYNMAQKQASGIKGLQGILTSALSEMYNNIGESQNSVIVGGYKLATSLVQNYETVGTALTALITTYGLYKAALVFNTSIDKTVTVMRYEVEIAELTKLLPLKEQEANADLKAAVASGKLTQSKAEQIIALRAEIESRRESIQSKLAEEQINLKSLEARRLESVEAIKRAQAKTIAAKEELANAIATAEGEKMASLQKKMGLESERQSRVALRIVKLQDQKDVAIEQARALKENAASAEKVAAKNREIASIHAKILAARQEEIQHGRNVAAIRSEIKAGVDVTANKNIQTLTNKVNTLSEKENAAATVQTGYAKQIVGKRVLIKKLATDAETISTQINTTEQNINTLSTNWLTAAKTRLITVAKNLWAVLAPNPMILAAAAAVALGYGIYKLATHTTELEQAQKRVNSATKDFQGEVASERAQIDILFGRLKAAKEGTEKYQKAKDEIISKYGKYLEGLSAETMSLHNVAEAYKAITENATKAAKARALESSLEKSAKVFGESYSKNITKIQDALLKEYGNERGTKIFSRLQEQMDAGLNVDQMSEEVQAAISRWDDAVTSNGAGIPRVVNFMKSRINVIADSRKVFEEENKRLNNVFDNILKIDDKGKEPVTPKIYGADYKAAEKEWKEAKAALSKIEKDRDKFTSDEYKKAKNREKTAKEAFESWGGKTKDTTKADESKAKKAKELANDEAELRKKLANEALQAELDNEQAVLDAKEDSYDKQFQLNDLNYRKELQKIKEYNDQKLKEQADFITKFGKKALPEELTDKSIKEQVAKKTNQAQYNYEAADSKTEKQRLEADQQAWNEYLKTYGDYEDKRLAIFNEYREKIGKAQTQGEKALLAGNRDKELQDLDQTLIEKSDLWVRLFDDASKHTTGYITETIKKVQQLIDYMKGVEGVEIPIGFTPEQIESLKKDPEKVKEILKGLKTQVDELNTRNPFNSLIQGFKDLKKAGKDTEKQYTATNKIISGIQGVREVVGQLSTAFTDLGMNSEDSLAKVMNVMDRTASMAQTGAQIAGPWGAAIGGAIGLATSLFSVLKKNKAQEDTEQLQDVTSKIETTNNSINRLLEKRIDLINEATAAEAGYLNTLTQEQIKQQQTYVQSMFDRLSGNEIFGKKGKNNNLSLSALMQKEGLSSMEEFVEWWNSNGVNKLIGEGYDLKNEDQWQSIVDSWEELSEAAENAEKAMKEAVTGISFDSLKDSLDDLVKSADTTFEDIGDSFNDHMRTAALKFAKSSYLTKALQDWYDKFAEYAQSGSTDDSFGLTPEETAELRKMYEDAYNKAQGLYDSALDAMGISKEDSDINGITGVAASITQDSANELNGNFYAVRQSLNDVRNINKQTQEYIKVQTGHISDVKEAVSSYKQVFADQLTYIKMTAENTAATASILREIRDNGLIMKR